MRPWSDGQLKSLRHLAAARFLLPVELNEGEHPGMEAQYLEFVHHTEYGLALEYLVDLGEMNRGHAEESLFWAELVLAAEHMNNRVEAEKCRGYLREVEASANADT
jgi:hypothetical protein